MRTATTSGPNDPLDALSLIVIIDAAIRALGVDAVGAGEFVELVGNIVDALFEDGLGLDGLEFGFEVF